MSTDLTYVRLTKLWDLSASSEDAQREASTSAAPEGSGGHRLRLGYQVDGWFLKAPRVGKSMVMLRFRRNELERIGVFTSSPVASVGQTEIRTVNTVYQIEHRTFEDDDLTIE